MKTQQIHSEDVSDTKQMGGFLSKCYEKFHEAYREKYKIVVWIASDKFVVDTYEKLEELCDQAFKKLKEVSPIVCRISSLS